MHELGLTAFNDYCEDEASEYILLIDDGIEVCDNGIDDDDDGYVDYFDPDCACEDILYQAVCPISCEYIPDSFPPIELTLKWSSEPVSNGFAYSNIVTGDVDGDGRIEVLTKRFWGKQSILSSLTDVDQEIVIFDGETGLAESDFFFTQLRRPTLDHYLSIADLDRDGISEIIFPLFDTLKCFSSSGNPIWDSPGTGNFATGDLWSETANITDFNGDGIPEAYRGASVFNAQNGQLLAIGCCGRGCNTFTTASAQNNACARKHSIAADLLPSSPGLELAAGNTMYEIEINNLSDSTGNRMRATIADAPITDGFTSVADVDGDGALDVIVVRNQNYPDGGGIWVWNPRTRGLIAQAQAGDSGGIPTIADLDGDCIPEIIVVFGHEIRTYKYNGTSTLQLLYQVTIQEQSGFNSATVFDLNQDGVPELIHQDETFFRIFEGHSGSILTSFPLNIGTAMETPIVADVDQDGAAEILVLGAPSNDTLIRIFCFESANVPWAPARSIWNQQGYHVTNVNDDLTIPRQPQNHAMVVPGYQDCLRETCPAPYNAFCSQATYRTQNGCIQTPASDYSIEILSYKCTPDSLIYELVIDQHSDVAIRDSCLFISCYEFFFGGSNNNALEVVTSKLNIDDSTGLAEFPDTVRLSTALIETSGWMYFTVNDHGVGPGPWNYSSTGILECDYINNLDSVWLDTERLPFDLGPDVQSCRGQVLTLNAGSGFESYRWNDLTTDSIYSSAQEGLHFVEAVDHCGRIYRDTVGLIIDASINLDIGSDTTLCPGDPYSFTIQGNYDDITWLPAGHVSCDTCFQVDILTDTPVILYAVASIGGCYIADTVALDVVQTIVVDEDVDICEGDVLEYRDSLLAAPGTYEFVVGECDSVFRLTLSHIGSDTSAFTDQICDGDSVFFANQWLTFPGLYSDTLANENGCDSLIFLTLEVDSIRYEDNTISMCQGDSIFLFNQWIHDEGEYRDTINAARCMTVFLTQVVEFELENGYEQFDLCPGDSIFIAGEWVFESGEVSAIYLDENGCDSTHTIELIIPNSPDPPISNLNCELGEIEMSLELEPEWNVEWNNGGFGPTTTYLDGDSAIAELYTSTGCFLRYVLELPVLPSASEIPNIMDTTVLLGDIIELDLPIDTTLWRLSWEPAEIFSCDYCSTVKITSNHSTTVELFLLHLPSGCTFFKSFDLNVVLPDVYIPNVFSPNDDGTNDAFVPLGSSEIEVTSFRIFSRWGETIYESGGFKLGDNLQGWNGQFRGKPMNSGVYAYLIELKDTSGKISVYAGDIALVQ